MAFFGIFRIRLVRLLIFTFALGWLIGAYGALKTKGCVYGPWMEFPQQQQQREPPRW